MYVWGMRVCVTQNAIFYGFVKDNRINLKDFQIEIESSSGLY